jgi:hypothetical protein
MSAAAGVLSSSREREEMVAEQLMSPVGEGMALGAGNPGQDYNERNHPTLSDSWGIQVAWRLLAMAASVRRPHWRRLMMPGKKAVAAWQRSLRWSLTGRWSLR